MLIVEDLNAYHGLLHAVRGISLRVGSGEVLALVGANGAGKTTLLRSIIGAHPSAQGRIVLMQRDLTALSAYQRVRRGVALVPEGRRLFAELTVEENLMLSRSAGRPGIWNVEAVMDALPQLKAIRNVKARSLSGGQQQATAIGRALMTNPLVLMLDEVSLGLSPAAVDQVYAALHRLKASGTTLILVEQDLGRSLDLANRVACMLEGRIVLQAEAANITRDQITDAYFGVARRHKAED
ncbi:ABC transporter ATP-binding protein [Bradyrhizobium tropiciagri]|nr:ABC transporter ATP-binding protein [Bradyrhizobium tropiciagri]